MDIIAEQLPLMAVFLALQSLITFPLLRLIQRLYDGQVRELQEDRDRWRDGFLKLAKVAELVTEPDPRGGRR